MIVKLARLDAFIMKNHWNIFQLKILLWLLHNAYVGNMTVQLRMFQLRLYNSKICHWAKIWGHKSWGCNIWSCKVMEL